MATLAERLIQLDKQEAAIKREVPTSVVYPVRSGTKDIKNPFPIGGKSLNIKKVARQPLQIYQGKEFLQNVNKNRETIKSQFVNPTRMPKILNQDVKPSTTQTISKYLGMVLMGGVVGQNEESGKIQKIEEMKLNKMTFLQEEQ